MTTHATQDELFWRVMTFVVASAANWYHATDVLAILSWIKRWPLTISQCMIAACYLWLVWALMPLIDTVHLLGLSGHNYIFSLPKLGRVSFLWHAAWLVVFPVIVAELFCVFRYGFRCSMVESLVLMITIPCVVRVLFEPLSLRTMERLTQFGWHGTIWQVNTFHAGLGLWQAWCALQWLSRPRWWSTALYGSAFFAGVLLLIW